MQSTAAHAHCAAIQAKARKTFLELLASDESMKPRIGTNVVGTVISVDNKQITIDIGVKFPAMLKRSDAKIAGYMIIAR